MLSLAVMILAATQGRGLLHPSSVQLLPAECGPVQSLAWISPGALLVGGSRGISRYEPATMKCSSIVHDGEGGIGSVTNLVADGGRFYAFSLPSAQYAGLVSDGSALMTRTTSGHFVFSDIAIRGRDRFFLGRFGLDTKTGLPFPVVWKSTVPEKGEEPAEPVPVHFVHSKEAIDGLRRSAPPHTGSLAVGGDGTLYVFTALEPGVYRYRADGEALPVMGTKLTMLSLPMAELFLYRSDPTGRYRNLINKQPTVDDLLATPAGPALVVRIATATAITWELWFPGPEDVRVRIPLDLSRPGPFGHIRCDVLGLKLACLLDHPRDPESPTPGPSSLYIFDLPRR